MGIILFINRKGAIPYEMITEYNSLDIVRDNGEFFLPHHFYSNDDVWWGIPKREKKLQKIKLANLGELNKTY